MMGHPDENTIEMYILKPASIASERRRELEEHLSECPGCRAVEVSLREYYSEFERGPEIDRALVTRVIKRAYSLGRVIRLTHYHPRPNTTAGQPYTGLLAAQAGEQGRRQGFETVGTFASETDHILLRVRQDTINRRVKIYYHAEDPQMREGAIVTIPDLPAEIVLDEHGQMEFGIADAKSAREWAAFSALIALPLAKAETERPAVGNEASTLIVADGANAYELTVSNKGESCTVLVRSMDDAPPVRRVVARDESGETVLVDLVGGSGTFSISPDCRRLLFRLYS
jgi:hypothetical protein